MISVIDERSDDGEHDAGAKDAAQPIEDLAQHRQLPLYCPTTFSKAALYSFACVGASCVDSRNNALPAT